MSIPLLKELSFRALLFSASITLLLLGGPPPSLAAGDPARTQTLLAPTAEILNRGAIRLSSSDFVLYRLEVGVSDTAQVGITALPIGAGVDGKYQYGATGSTKLSLVGLGGSSFGGDPTFAIAHAATFSPWIFQINTLAGLGTMWPSLYGLGSLGASIQLGGHFKFLTEVTANLSGHKIQRLEEGPDGFGIVGFRVFGDSFSADLGVALYSDILRPGIDYFPAFPLLTISYRTN